MIYLAPLQGFTDLIYRKAFSEVFTGIDAFFIPYISVKNNQVLKKYSKEVLPENNPQTKVVPQVLVNKTSELLFLSKFLSDYGYQEINLNLGCPYPMVTNRKMGSGLLPFPEEINLLLQTFFEQSNLQLSVKFRAGLESADEIKKIVPVLNRFPLSEVILHPRIARQIYSGNINNQAYSFAQKNLHPRLVYNGDVFSLSDFNNVRELFPGTKDLMVGRGVLMNPFLPSEIDKGVIFRDKRRVKLEEFQQTIFDLYSQHMDNPGNVLNKLKQFWIYFSYNFPDQKKVLKQIKKSRSLADYKQKVKSLFLLID